MVTNMKLLIGLSILIVIIIVIRAIVEGKISRKAQYAMWLSLPIFVIVASFANIPVNITVPNNNYSVSKSTASELINHPSRITTPSVNSTIEIDDSIVETENIMVKTTEPTEIISASLEIPNTTSINTITKAEEQINYELLFKTIWLCGAVIVASIIIINNLIFIIRVHKSRELIAIAPYNSLRVYKLEGIKSPFLFGRNIYITNDLKKDSIPYNHAICHEYCHYKQGDSLWVLLRYAFTIVLWFNPLIWIAAEVSSRDGELAVDEQVIKMLGKDNKKSYSETLLSFLTVETNREHFIASTSMSGKNTSFMRTRLLSIMRGSKTNIALTLIISILLSAFVGCNTLNRHNIREASYVNKDSLWYDYTQTLYGNEQYAEYGVSHIYMRPELITPSMRIFELCLYENEYNTTSGRIPTKIVSYSPEGELLGSISCDVLSDNEAFDEFFQVQDECRATIYDYARNELKTCTLDFNKGTITNIHNAVSNSKYDLSGLYGITEFNGKLYQKFEYNDDYVFKPGLMITDLDGNVEFEMKLPYDIIRWTIDSNGEFLCMGHRSDSIDFSFEFFTVDTETNSINVINASKEITDRYAGNTMLSGDYAYMKNQDNTITQLNVITQEEIVVFDFNCSYANFNDIDFFDLFYLDDDEFILVRNGCWQGPKEDYYGREIIHLTRANSNPNAGKQILTVASVDWITPTESYAISTFNKTSEKYFVSVDTKYDVRNYYQSDNLDIDTYDKAYNYIMDKLFVDINEGTGPDILLNAGTLPEFCTDKVLLDLNEYMDGDNGINRNEYFDNCFTTSNIDGKLYQIPISIQFSGMLVDPETIAPNQNGFTFDEYNKYCETYGCYELSMATEKGDSFYTWFNISEAQFIGSDGHLDINNDDFKSLMDLVDTTAEGSINNDTVRYYDFFDFYTTLLFNGNNVTKKQLEWTLCGFPSKDGRGATLRNKESCGITSCCSAKDGAWEFIKTAISEEVQDELVYFPININSFERMGNYWIEYGNNYMYGVFNKENYFSYDVVDTFETWIKSIDVAYYKYPIANIIINEEMPAYFKGNKDINTVIGVIEDRVNTMIDERKW